MTTAQPVMPTSPRGEQYEDLFPKSSNKPFITNPSDIGPELTLPHHSKPKLGTLVDIWLVDIWLDYRLVYKLKWQLEITVQESQSGKEKPSGGVGMEDGEDYVRLSEALRNLSSEQEKQELLSSDYIFQLYQAIYVGKDRGPYLKVEDLYEQIKRLSKDEKRHIMRLMAKDSQLCLTAEDLYEQIKSLPIGEKRHILSLLCKELAGPPIQPRVTKRRRDLLYKVVIPEFGREYENNLSPKQVSRLVDTITPAMLRDCLKHYPDVSRYYKGLDDAALRALLFHDLKSIKTEPKRYL
jgi:hypothetical protein